MRYEPFPAAGRSRRRASREVPLKRLREQRRAALRVALAAAPRVGKVVMDTIDARRSAEFWRLLLVLVYRDGHGPVAPGEDDEAGRDWLNVRLPDGTPLLAFQQVAELPRNNLARSARAAAAHLDLTVDRPGAVHTRPRARSRPPQRQRLRPAAADSRKDRQQGPVRR